MGKRQQKELRRLEKALLEQETPEDEMQALEDSWQGLSSADYAIYNTDTTDVDMDTFSEEVHRGHRKRPFLSVFRLLLFAAILWLLLRFWEVI